MVSMASWSSRCAAIVITRPRVLRAPLGVGTSLITAVGRDAPGRALLDDIRSDAVSVRAIRPQGRRTGRIAVLLGPAGERSFVADRGAADLLAPADLRPGWFSGCD